MGDTADKAAVNAAELRRRLDFDDAKLLAECEIHLHRTGGPGGQHRNKVSSAVRLCHKPTGFVVTAGERRSQHENRANALRRLREAIAVGVRCPTGESHKWPEGIEIKAGHLRVGEHNPALWAVIALVLDEVAAQAGQVSAAATRLGVSTSSLTRFLADWPKAWVEAQRIRQAHGLGPLHT